MTILARFTDTAGRIHVGVVDGGVVHLTEFQSILDWHNAGEVKQAERLANATTRFPWVDSGPSNKHEYALVSPLDPPEVWAFGFTYERGPQFAASPAIPSGPAYQHAIDSVRPEIFFKTTGSRVVGPNEKIGIRGDSRYTAVEAELCLVVDGEGNPIFATAGNDVSAWDIEAMNPLWLAQCKTYEACCALGPVAVTLDEIPSEAQVYCRVYRDAEKRFDASIPLSKLRWSYKELADFASHYNPLPSGSVLMTGTAIIRPNDESLADGDLVEIEIDGIGVLRNVAKQLTSSVSAPGYY